MKDLSNAEDWDLDLFELGNEENDFLAVGVVDNAEDTKYLEMSCLFGHCATNLNNAFEHHYFDDTVQYLNTRKLTPSVGNFGKTCTRDNWAPNSTDASTPGLEHWIWPGSFRTVRWAWSYCSSDRW